MMTRKHFKAIAESIAKIENLDSRVEAYRVMADMCEKENVHFDRKRFREACKID
jgi:hypothetical protein